MEIFTVAQVAQKAQVSPTTVYQAIYRGDLIPMGRTSNGLRAHYRFTGQNIADWLGGTTAAA